LSVAWAGFRVATATRLGSWTALLPVAAFTVYIDRVQIAAEEPALLANFGAEYEAYRASVPRWLDLRSVTVARDLAGRTGRRVPVRPARPEDR
jgi:hypothetical protein